ncbi:MAG: FKBP-type peptidyl-prolyl cis-trans isomerase, partial [Bacteroidales bacterium]|nr:FKBP-type peptidyl-prolyl cis-trans isomerase [Bacteroidales bacterium]
QNAPVGLKQSDEIYFYVRLKNVIDYDHFIEEKNSKELPNTKEEETKLLERYIKMSNIEVPPTNSGLYFIEDLAGQGELPQRGQIMTLNYLGYFINGESFSNTYETRRPFNVKLGEDDLISGFQEGLMKMKAKGHYTLVIPSHLAYGEEGTKTIPPNTTLIFEIDVISIQ